MGEYGSSMCYSARAKAIMMKAAHHFSLLFVPPATAVEWRIIMKITDGKFCSLYPITKTIRFELIPVGKTLEHIEKNGILNDDALRAENYKKMKKSIDAYHRNFIELAMKDVKLSGLMKYFELYSKASGAKETKEFEAEFNSIKKSLRQEIVDTFSKGEAKPLFDKLFKKELIKNDLKEWCKKNDVEFIDDFKTFTTYFDGYHENRKNMYLNEEKSTAISYRLINENLPKFINNIFTFEKIKKTDIADYFDMLMTELNLNIKVASVEEVFNIIYFNNTLTQTGIDFYNAIIGGISTEKVKLKGLNEYINLYNQEQNNKNKRLPKLKMLYKQILSIENNVSFLPQPFENKQELCDAVEAYYSCTLRCGNALTSPVDVLKETECIIKDISSYDTEKIYLKNDTGLTNISQRLFGSHSVIASAINNYYNEVINPKYVDKLKKTIDIEKLEKEKRKFTGKDYFSIAQIQTAIELFVKTRSDDTDENKRLLINFSPTCIADYFKNYFFCEKESKAGHKYDLISNVEAKYNTVKGILNTNFDEEFTMQQKDSLKMFLDSLMEILHFVKVLNISEKAGQKSEEFYGAFEPLFDKINKLPKLYDKVRNYMTKKPYIVEKIKLNFDSPTLLNGWVDSITENSDNGTQNGGYLFRKVNGLGEYDYFLGISNNKKLFRASEKVAASDRCCFERLNYYQPKETTIYGKSYCGKDGSDYPKDRDKLLDTMNQIIGNQNNNQLIEKLNSDKQKKKPSCSTPSGLFKFLKEEGFGVEIEKIFGNAEFTNQNNLIITNLQETLKKMIRLPAAVELSKKSYKLFTEIIKEIETVCKEERVFDYIPVNEKEFLTATANSDKPLYLFRISNKDLSFAQSFLEGKRKKSGTKNLHTMYFEALMSGEQKTYDIGTGEIFYRKASIKEHEKVVHYKNQSLQAKNPKTSNSRNTFAYDIVKDKRYTADKFQFHLSLMMNYNADSKANINKNARDFLKNNPDVNIIGIDRGERHLLYISLINQKGDFVCDSNGMPIQYSLNTICGSYKDSSGNEITFETPYHTLLHNKGEKNAQDRKNWGEIEAIKDLKEGYLSQAVSHITRLMVEYNAIVVMEDLNFGFKRGRFKVEKQVYQKFEKMLIDKLNFLVLKDKKSNEVGGLYKALQLTEKFESFRKLDKQSGFIFYVPAWNTSKIDPKTGFVDLLKPDYENIPQAQKFFAAFEFIRYNIKKDYFEFSFDYSKFRTAATPKKTHWTVCTFGDKRVVWNKSLNNNKGAYEVWNVTGKIKELLSGDNIDWQSGTDIRESLIVCSSSKLLSAIIKCLKVTLAMRYSSSAEGEDYILSPVGDFFDSRTGEKLLPNNGDANGAYHIAMKGLMLLKRINVLEAGGTIDMNIKNNDWLNFVQNREF